MTSPIRSAQRCAAILTILAAAAVPAAFPAAAQEAAREVDEARRMTVVKTPWCSCCSAWADRMREAGFLVTIEEREDLAPVRRAAGVPDAVTGCHTARVGGYVLEGHVPAEAVHRLLDERPDVAGLAVPGMPAGSPGMGDDPNARFDVLTFDPSGPVGVFYRAGR